MDDKDWVEQTVIDEEPDYESLCEEKDKENERLRGKLENMTVDYSREKNEKDVLVKVLDKIENVEGNIEYLRKIAGEAIKRESNDGQNH